MPAPVPIEFTADIGPLGELAFAAGRAQGRRRDFERQQSLDFSFLRDAMAQRQRQNEVEVQFRLQSSVRAEQRTQQTRQAFQLQQAGRQLRQDQRNALADTRRVESAGGRSSLRRALDSVTEPQSQTREQLVNINPQGGGSVRTKRGIFTLHPDGSVVREGPSVGNELVDPITGEFDREQFRRELPDELRDPAALARDRALTGGTGFVRSGRGSADLVTMSVAEQLQTLAAAKNLSENDRVLLERTIRSGGLDPKQLLDEIQQRTPRADDERKIDGLSIRDRELRIGRLEDMILRLGLGEDPDGMIKAAIEDKIREQREIITRQRLIKDAPQLSGRSLANPNPSTTGTVLTETAARQFLQQANGDPNVARIMARNAGFTIPQL